VYFVNRDRVRRSDRQKESSRTIVVKHLGEPSFSPI